MYDAEAKQLGLNRTQYVRQCIEIGRTVFQSSGQADVERLRQLTEDTQTTTTNSDLLTANNDISETILANLPTEEQRALTKEEIRKAVFGTKDEQIKQVTNALKELHHQEAIEPLVEDGYIKTND